MHASRSANIGTLFGAFSRPPHTHTHTLQARVLSSDTIPFAKTESSGTLAVRHAVRGFTP
jgi:hypothetical protein